VRVIWLFRQKDLGKWWGTFCQKCLLKVLSCPNSLKP